MEIKLPKILILILIIISLSISGFYIGRCMKTNLNHATYEEICEALYEDDLLEGKRAEIIFKNKPYDGWKDVERLKGIGSDTIEELKSNFRLDL